MNQHTPYTHFAISVEPGTTPQAMVSFHTPELMVHASVLEPGRPFLNMSGNEVEVSISTTGGGPVTTADLSIARKISAAAARYLADCERLHREQVAGKHATDSGAHGGAAASGKADTATTGGEPVA